jgi:signal transduction histidine kinase
LSETKAIRALVTFSRLASEAKAPEDIAVLLADALDTAVHAPAVAVFLVRPGGKLVLTAGHRLPFTEWELDAELFGDELLARLKERCGDQLHPAQVLPLVATGDLLGAIALCAKPGADLPSRVVAEAVADIGAIALGKAHQLSELLRTNEELRASRQALAQSEKLRSLGEMAAGVSHDLKGILNGLSLPLQALKREVDLGDAGVEELVHAMEQTIRRGVETVERLRDFSRQKPSELVGAVAVDPLLEEAVRLARSRLHGAAHAIELRFEPGAPPPIMVPPAELVTSVMNLVVNAIDAMDKAGHVTVSSRVDGDRVTIEVVDTGQGMRPEVQQRIFEPVFTTTGTHGTGLGLAMAYAFVQRHHGTIELDTAPGAGTTFTLRFPIATE